MAMAAATSATGYQRHRGPLSGPSVPSVLAIASIAVTAGVPRTCTIRAQIHGQGLCLSTACRIPSRLTMILRRIIVSRSGYLRPVQVMRAGSIALLRGRKVSVLSSRSLLQVTDQVPTFLRFRNQEIHIIAWNKRIGIGQPFFQRRFIPDDMCFLQSR